MTTAAPRILFVAEAISLAQVVRLVTLARALDPQRFDVSFASARFDPLLFTGTSFARHAIASLPAAVVDRRVARGMRPYDQRKLAAYVREDVALLERLRPDLVVSDLRLSLTISAPVTGVPHANLINAYWSPHAHLRDAGFPLPDHPLVKLLGVRVASKYFPRALPRVFDHFARPVNVLRRAHGLPPIGGLPQILTHGDFTLFPDVPALVPVRPLPTGQLFLGHLPWSPPVALPAWWTRLDRGRPTVYVTMGSSGRADRLPLIVDGAAAAGWQVLVATAGRASLPAATSRSAHVYAADYLPGHLAARRADVVISNGGSTTSYQALAEGRPVLGVPFNLDQYLAIEAVERFGAGLSLRSGTVSARAVGRTLQRLVSEPSFVDRARRLRDEFAFWNAGQRFARFVDAVINRRSFQ